MINDAGKLSCIKPYSGDDVIYIGDGNCLPISHTGDAYIKTQKGKLDLKVVLVVLEYKKILFFVEKFTLENLCTFKFTSFGFVVKSRIEG